MVENAKFTHKIISSILELQVCSITIEEFLIRETALVPYATQRGDGLNSGHSNVRVVLFHVEQGAAGTRADIQH